MIDFDIVRLTKDHNVLAFDCGNKDINDFLMEDAYDYQEGLLAVTYLALNKSQHAESLQEIVLTLSARSVRLLISFKMVVTYCDEEKG